MQLGLSKKIGFNFFLLISLIFIGCFVAANVKAAGLSLSPSSKNLTVGDIFKVTVFVNTSGQDINSTQATISFPANLLEVVSLDRSGIFSLWVQGPSFSNSSGSVFFTGGLPSPGYNGSAGRILSITFKAKKVGSALVSFSSASVGANDGLGTNVLKSRSQANFSIAAAKPVEPVKEKPKTEIKPANTPETTTPTVPVEEKVNINPKDFYIKEIERIDLTNPRVQFIFSTEDSSLGIVYFEIQIDNKIPEIMKSNKDNQYTTPVLEPGEHIIIVKRFDVKNNYKVASANFVIEVLKAPEITQYPKKLSTLDNLAVKGTTYANSKVSIWLQKENEEPKVFIAPSEETGVWNYISSDELAQGNYKLWAGVSNSQGANSLLSQKYNIIVKKGFDVDVIVSGNKTILIIILLTILAMLFVLMGWYSWRKFKVLKAQIQTKKNINISKKDNSKIQK